jgi:hypothetical protein
MEEKYRIRYWFEWGGFCLWSDNSKADNEFGSAIYPDDLPLSAATVARIEELATWHDQALNWNSPAYPGPWRQAECDRFNQAALELYEIIKAELGADFELVNDLIIMFEDPDLDEYLKDPQGFKRKS